MRRGTAGTGPGTCRALTVYPKVDDYPKVPRFIYHQVHCLTYRVAVDSLRAGVLALPQSVWLTIRKLTCLACFVDTRHLWIGKELGLTKLVSEIRLRQNEALPLNYTRGHPQIHKTFREQTGK